ENQKDCDRKGANRFFDMYDMPPVNDTNDNNHKIKLDKLKFSCVGPYDDPSTSFFYQPIVPPYLIEYFVSMEHFADSDFNLYCVYNFPAVALTLTKKNWHLAYDLLLYLAADIQWKVRKTIAMFICEIATIVGREYTHKDLLPIFLGFFKDLDEVKIEALKNLPTFLSVIDTNQHKKVIINLVECLHSDNDSNWRFREELGRQLLNLIKTYGTVYRVKHMIVVTGIAIYLLSDKVSAVRMVAMDAIAEKCCTATPIELKFMVEFLVEDFARHKHWRRRQTFLYICQELICKHNSLPFEVFETLFLPHILGLANDKIPNIRLAVVRLLSLLLTYNSNLVSLADHPVVTTIASLQEDVDNDVKFLAKVR
ncbi:Serine/threonine-protein phosphatase 4 regulatory subunit 1, partial [Pseudolycoriella hygida]